MHVKVAQIAVIWRLVLDRGQPAEAFFIHVHPERVNSAHINVNSQIEFQFVDKKWFVEVPLYNVVVIRV